MVSLGGNVPGHENQVEERGTGKKRDKRKPQRDRVGRERGDRN